MHGASGGLAKNSPKKRQKRKGVFPSDRIGLLESQHVLHEGLGKSERKTKEPGRRAAGEIFQKSPARGKGGGGGGGGDGGEGHRAVQPRWQSREQSMNHSGAVVGERKHNQTREGKKRGVAPGRGKKNQSHP